MPAYCKRCTTARAILKRPKTGDALCKECFFYIFEEEVHNTIKNASLFKEGDVVAIGASGGKGVYACNISSPRFFLNSLSFLTQIL